MIRCQRMHRESRPWIFLAGRFRSGENPGGGVWRTRGVAGVWKTRAATFPYHCAASQTPIPSQEQAVFVQDDVGSRNTNGSALQWTRW